ncbi:Unknown protein sequence [Pseudomonas syringae pv. syringae]|nr:Unknown protein sequence [Pseudomonas syringae pv. syringae]
MTRSVTNGIPTLEHEERYAGEYAYRAYALPGHAVLDALRLR